MFHQKEEKHRDQKFIEVNTENICLLQEELLTAERVISKRLNMQAVGYSASMSMML